MFVRVGSGKAKSVDSKRSVHGVIAPATRKIIGLGGASLALMLMASPAALAETCSSGGNLNTIGNVTTNSFFASSTAGALASAISTASTAFLLQSTAFVSNPSNPAPDQQGAGVWVRAVGGSVNANAASTSQSALIFPSSPGNNLSGPVNCDTKVHQNFAGIQFGQDIAKLNHNGWNFNFGTTAGYLEARGSTIGNNYAGSYFNSTVQTPFFGTYLVATKGGFFADALLRGEYYQANLDSPSLNIVNQKLNAHGISIAGSAGYNYAIPNSKWFVEPSVGVVWSRTTVDPFNVNGPPAGNGINGTLSINDIHSTIGRAGLRVGTTVENGQWILQPFAAASIWHEFDSAPTANYTSCTACAGVGGIPGFGILTSAFTGTTVGTYGQYSLGLSGKLINTGVVAFGRVDYRQGPNLDGWDVTGGIRYDFTPEAIAAIGKSPVYKAAPVAAAPNWTGFYIGASAGAAAGREPMGFTGIVGTPNLRSAGFIGGVDAGYNRQFGQWVAGIEADWDWTNLNGATACTPLPAPPSNTVALGNTTCASNAAWLATFTGRMGYAWGRALMYVKGGAAWTHETFSVNCNLQAGFGAPCLNAAGVAFASPSTASDNRMGWTVGYGVEYAMTAKWSAKAETNYMSFGTRNVTATDGTVINAGQSVMNVKVGVNYKLF